MSKSPWSTATALAAATTTIYPHEPQRRESLRSWDQYRSEVRWTRRLREPDSNHRSRSADGSNAAASAGSYLQGPRVHHSIAIIAW